MQKRKRKSFGKTVVYQWDDQQSEVNIIDDQEKYKEEREYFQSILSRGQKLLSEQENKVFALLSLGYKEKEISERLNISRSSIKGYRKRIIEKFESLDDIEA